jgi:hypothetical protein
VLAARFPGAVGLHGGPPVVLVPGAVANDGKPYYLGIVHYKKWRDDGLLYYPHYFYKTQPHPPFRIIQVAYRPLPLQLEDKADAWRRRIAFASGQWLDRNERRLYISYGSADKNARLLAIPAGTIDQFFRPRYASTVSSATAAAAAAAAAAAGQGGGGTGSILRPAPATEEPPPAAAAAATAAAAAAAAAAGGLVATSRGAARDASSVDAVQAAG